MGTCNLKLNGQRLINNNSLFDTPKEAKKITNKNKNILLTNIRNITDLYAQIMILTS